MVALQPSFLYANLLNVLNHEAFEDESTRPPHKCRIVNEAHTGSSGSSGATGRYENNGWVTVARGTLCTSCNSGTILYHRAQKTYKLARTS